MHQEQTLVNRYGDRWIVEYRESERLTNISGFLMTVDDLSSITLSTRLPEEVKPRVRALLRDRLRTLPIGTAEVYLWNAGAEPGSG